MVGLETKGKKSNMVQNTNIYSHTNFSTISVCVCVACKQMPSCEKTYLLNVWSWDLCEEKQYGPELNYIVTH
jgi:hypothetical protein